jgi:hypothetical protein
MNGHINSSLQKNKRGGWLDIYLPRKVDRPLKNKHNIPLHCRYYQHK